MLGLKKLSNTGPRPTRVMIDGMNLALEKGTGVATYARGLSQALHAIGKEVHVLYGTRSGGKNPFRFRGEGRNLHGSVRRDSPTIEA